MRIDNVHPLEIISDIIVNEMKRNKYFSYDKIRAIITRKIDYEFVIKLSIYNYNHNKRTPSFKKIRKELWEDFVENMNPYDKIAIIYKNYSHIKKSFVSKENNEIRDLVTIDSSFSVDIPFEYFNISGDRYQLYQYEQYLTNIESQIGWRIRINRKEDINLVDICTSEMAFLLSGTKEYKDDKEHVMNKIEINNLIDSDILNLITNKLEYEKNSLASINSYSMSEKYILSAYEFIYFYFLKKSNTNCLITNRLKELEIDKEEFEKIEIPPNENINTVLNIHPLDLIAGLIQFEMEKMMEQYGYTNNTKDTIISIFTKVPEIDYLFNTELNEIDANYVAHVVYGSIYLHDHKNYDIAEKVIRNFPNMNYHDIIMKIKKSYSELNERILYDSKVAFDVGYKKIKRYDTMDMMYTRLLLCDYPIMTNIKTLEVVCDSILNLKNKFELFRNVMKHRDDKEQILKNIALILLVRTSTSPYTDKLKGVTNSDCDREVDNFFKKIHQMDFDDIENIVKVKKYVHSFRENLVLLKTQQLENYGIDFPLNLDDIIDTAVKIYMSTFKYKINLFKATISMTNDMRMINRREGDLPMSIDMFHEMDTRFHITRLLFGEGYKPEGDE